MATEKQRAAARRSIRRAQAAAAEKRTIAHLPPQTRSALGRQASAVKRGRARRSS